MVNAYLWIKAFHLIAVISWMAALLYLPRLYVYHADAVPGSDVDKTLQLMEKKLLRFIMNPAMIVTFSLGIALVAVVGMHNLGGWFHLKLMLVIILAALHGMMAKWRKDFERGNNIRSAKFYRIINEIPAVIMVVIVILAVVKPF
jgi:putative membrane protein